MLVSIVICAYNYTDTLEAALDSAFNQTLSSEDYEVLLVDDGSTDRLPELVGVYQKQHPNFRYLRFPINRGLVAASNYGFQAAHGTYFTRLDADDALHPDMLASCLRQLQSEDANFAYCDYYEIALDEEEQ